MRRATLSALLLAVLLLPMTAGAQTVASDPAAVRIEVGTLLDAGRYAEARAVLVAAGAAAVDRDYLDGVILQRQGQNRAAIVLFRRLLAADPLLGAVRLSLVESLIAVGDIRASIHHLDVLIGQDPDRGRRERYAALRRQLLDARRTGFTTGLSIVPSTNVNGATVNRTVDVSGIPFEIDETGESGVGVNLSLGGFHRVPLGGRWALTLNGGLFGTAFSNPDFNRGGAVVSAAFQRQDANVLWQVTPAVQRTIYANEADDNTQFALSVLRRTRAGERGLLDLNLGLRHLSFDATENSLYEGFTLQAGASLRHRLGPRTELSTGLALERGLTRDRRFAYRGLRVEAGIARTFANGWQAEAVLEAAYRPYDAIFDPFGEVRRDRSLSLSVSALNSRIEIRGATPQVGCSAQRTWSNIPFYDNRNVLECSLGFTRNF